MKLFSAITLTCALACQALLGDFQFKFADSSLLKIKSEQSPIRITNLCYMRDVWQLAACAQDSIFVFDAQTLQPLVKIFDEKISTPKECAYNSSSLYIASGDTGRSGKLLKADLKNKTVQILAQAGDEFLCVDVSANGDFLAAGAADGTLIILNIKTGETILRQNFKEQKVVSAKFNSTSNTLAVLLSSGFVFSRNAEDNFKENGASFSAKTNAQSLLFMGKTNVILAADFSYESKLIYADRFIEKRLRAIAIPVKNPSVLKVRFDVGFPFAMANYKGDLAAAKFSFQTPEFSVFEKSQSPILDIAPAPSGAIFASTSNGEIFLWNNKTLKIACGIVLLDKNAEDFAVFSTSGFAYCTKKDAALVLSKDGKDISTERISKEKTTEFVSKEIRKPSKKRPVQNGKNAKKKAK